MTTEDVTRFTCDFDEGVGVGALRFKPETVLVEERRFGEVLTSGSVAIGSTIELLVRGILE
jgi:hypothetical protein